MLAVPPRPGELVFASSFYVARRRPISTVFPTRRSSDLPIVHHRASTHPCAWRGPGPGRWRSWGQIVAHETTLRCLSDSCQLDSGLNELSRVRSTTRRHGEVLSQVRCPGGWRPVIRVAGRPPLERGGGGVGGAVDGRRASTG